MSQLVSFSRRILEAKTKICSRHLHRGLQSDLHCSEILELEVAIQRHLDEKNMAQPKAPILLTAGSQRLFRDYQPSVSLNEAGWLLHPCFWWG